jgi:diguanylate cyclase (GGDEF)-like protein/PAS domain S-box-containing protein
MTAHLPRLRNSIGKARISGNLLLAAVYGLSGILLHAAILDPLVPTMWPQSGIALAALLLRGYRLVPGLLLGAFGYNLWMTGNTLASCGIALSSTIAAMAATWLLRREGFRHDLTRLRDVVMLVVFGAIIDPLLAATLGQATLLALDLIGTQELARVSMVWWIDDALGVLMLTPLFLTLHSTRGPLRFVGNNVEAWLLIALQAAIAFAIFYTPNRHLLSATSLIYLLLPGSLTLAIRHAALHVAAANLVVFAVAVSATLHGQPFLGDPVGANGILEMHFVLAVMAAVSQAVNTVSYGHMVATERFRDLNDLSADWYWEQDTRFRFTLISGGVQAKIGIGPSPNLGLTRWEAHPQEEVDIDWEPHRQDLAAHKAFEITFSRRRPDGGELWIYIAGRPIYDAGRRFQGYRGIGRDLTAEKLAQKARLENEERLRAIARFSADWYWEQDENLRFTLIMGSTLEYAGLPVEKIVGKTRFELPNSFESDEARNRHEIDLAAHRPFRDVRMRLETGDGHVRYVRIHGEPITDGEGNFRGYRGVGSDVTRETLLIERESRLRQYYEILSEVNEIIARAPPSQSLFKQVCDIVISKGGVEFVQVLLLNESTRRVETGFYSGADHGLAPLLYFSLDSTLPEGRGAAAQALLSGEALVCNDLRVDSRIGQRDLLLDAGLLCACSFPLRVAGSPFGALNLYSRKANYFDDELVSLLERLAFDLGVALDNNLHKQAQANAERAVVESHKFLDDVLNTVPGPILVKDSQHRYIALNDAQARFLGRPRDQLVGITDFDIFPPERAAYFQQTDDVALASPTPIEYETQYPVAGGVRTMYVRKSALTRADGSRVLVLVMTDVTARREAEKSLRASEERFRDFAAAAGEYVWENDRAGRFTYISAKAADVLGYTTEELVGHMASEFMPPGEIERVRVWLEQNTQPDGSFRGLEHQFVSKTGPVLWLSINGVATLDEQGNRTGHRGTTRDITSVKLSEARITFLATRDYLTGLPNRVLLNDRLQQAIMSARRSGAMMAIMFIDLDRFKTLNDSLGHVIGDKLLKEVATRMETCLRKNDTLSRFGGDEFVVILENLATTHGAAHAARRIIDSLAQPFDIGGYRLNTSCSIGISVHPSDADEGAELIKNADTAMYYAKEQGRTNFQFFSPEMNTRAVERQRLETELRHAIEANQFVLHYQPQANILTGKIVGMEVLIRWQHPKRGLVPPASFVSVAEDSGLIEQIGLWALRTACEQNQRWRSERLSELKVAVNISARQLNNPQAFSDSVTKILSSTGLDARLLELEMTEGLLLKNIDENSAFLLALGRQGIRVAVDDFGTGYSSLSYLKKLPIDTLKIDGSFVRDIETDEDDATIVQAIIAMAHGLKLRVTAEGVETAGQLTALRRLGCDEYQGYLLAKPMPAEEFATCFLAPINERETILSAPALRGRARRA